jgi:hypothetical protein
MRRRPAKPTTARKLPARLRDAEILEVPTVRAEKNKATVPTDPPEQETEAEAAVRRMVEAAYT